MHAYYCPALLGQDDALEQSGAVWLDPEDITLDFTSTGDGDSDAQCLRMLAAFFR